MLRDIVMNFYEFILIYIFKFQNVLLLLWPTVAGEYKILSDINKLVINRKIDMYYLIITRFDSHIRL